MAKQNNDGNIKPGYEHWPKWYVVSGTLKCVCIAKSPEYACYLALSRCQGVQALDGCYFFVDERGFRSDGQDGKGAEHWLRTADVIDYCQNMGRE
jgi:hypothetical protein